MLSPLRSSAAFWSPQPLPCCALGRYNFFTGCPKAKTCTIILRGGAEQFMEETERSLHDAIMIVRRAIKVRTRGGTSLLEISPGTAVTPSSSPLTHPGAGRGLSYWTSAEAGSRSL